MRTSLFIVLVIFAFASPDVSQAGRYDGLVDIFNSVAKNIDPPPPPKKLDYEYKPQGGDAPGMNGPSIGGSNYPAPSQPTYTPPSSSLSDTFNDTASGISR